jgi:oligoendopeptidase F
MAELAEDEAVWDLSDLYTGPEDSRIAVDLEAARDLAVQFTARYEGELEEISARPQDLLVVIREYEKVHEIGLRPYNYAYLLLASDTQDHQKSSFFKRIEQAWHDIALSLLFFQLEIRGLPEDRLKWLTDRPELAAYRRFFLSAWNGKPHTLSRTEESILAEKTLSGRKALADFHEEFLGSLRFEIEMDGEIQLLTKDQAVGFLHSSNPSLREGVFRNLHEGLARQSTVFRYIFNTFLQDYNQENKLRGHVNPMQRAHLEHQIDPGIADVMLRAVEAYYPVIREYYTLKARALGIGKLMISDLHAPLGKKDLRWGISKAKTIILNAFEKVDPFLHDIIARFFSESWIDSKPRPGKRGGAFCVCLTPLAHSYISINYTGTLRDLMILAHELGHGVHQRLSAQQGFINFEPSPLLAETAATFFETLLICKLAQEEEFRHMRQALLAGQIESAITTVFRQNVLTRFEQAIHLRRGDHLLSADEISQIWWQENERLYGNSVKMLPCYQWGWMSVPHLIHLPFFCYSYVFGYLVSMVFVESYKSQGRIFLNKLIEMLGAGSSEAPVELISQTGWNLEGSSFWQHGLGLIGQWVASFAATLEGGR